jgi:hypothetical protein
MLNRILLWWKQRNCEHYWRPVLLRGSTPARWCDYCEKDELLTEPEFYAQFGRMPWL